MFFVTVIPSPPLQICLSNFRVNFIGEKNVQVYYTVSGPRDAGVLFTSNVGQAHYFDSALKRRSISQSVCMKNCDTKGQKCLITCDDKATSDNCKKNLNHVTPFRVLEVIPKRAPP